MPNVTIHLPKEIEEKVNNVLDGHPYLNRSSLISDIIRHALSAYPLKKEEKHEHTVEYLALQKLKQEAELKMQEYKTQEQAFNSKPSSFKLPSGNSSVLKTSKRATAKR